MKGSGKMVKDVEEVNKFGMTDQYMKGFGIKTKPMDMEDLYMQMEMYMKENG